MTASRDPIHEEDGKWYFYDETWLDRYGPFPTRKEAYAAMKEYARDQLGIEIP